MAATRPAGQRPDATSPPSDALALRVVRDGVLLPVRVTPRASQSRLDGVVGGALRVRLTAPPVEGVANAALVALLAEYLGVPKSAIIITAGAGARQKMLHVTGVTLTEIAARLGQVAR